MNRMDFQALADLRLREAEILLAAGAWDGAYYLAGYAVECALKACIAKKTREYDFPPPPKTTSSYYTHDLKVLRREAELDDPFKEDEKARPDLELNWVVVSRWSEQSRYDRHQTEATAQALVTAIIESTDGVLPWIKRHW